MHVSSCYTYKIYNYLIYGRENPKDVRYPTVANVFIYFYLNNTYQIELLTTGGRVVKLLKNSIFEIEKHI